MQIQQRNRVSRQRPAFLTLAVGLVALAATLVPKATGAFAVFKVDPYCPGVYSNIQDAVDAAAAYADADYFDYVWIANNVSYSNQHIVINDQRTVIIEGGFADCNDFDPGTEHTTISGAGNGGYPVFEIAGNNSAVVLLNLNITGAQTSGSGGGIAFAGHGELDIGQTNVYLNQANYGGGINFYGDSNGATLYLWADATLLNNTANVSGGGVRVEGSARLYALQQQTWIGYNHANGGYGGGVEILGPARADIGSGGYNGVGVISYNDAVDGGGAAAIPASGNDATLRIFTTDPANPVQIDNNVASGTGGGVYLGATAIGSGNLCAFDFRLHDNAGTDGAAVFADTHSESFYDDNGGRVFLNVSPPSEVMFGTGCGPESPPTLGAVDCAAGTPCNEIRGNQAVDLNAVPTSGAVISAGSAAGLQGDPFSLRDNAAATLIRLYGGSNAPYVASVVRNCLIADNHTQHELISIHDGRGFGINGCTITHNAIDNGYVIYANTSSGLTLVNSIIDQPGRSVLDYVGEAANRSIDYVIANETFTLPGAQHTQGNTPVYVDAANGDYHLGPHSPGVDYAPTQAGSDLDGNPRSVDLASVANLYGPRDLGAYERQIDGCGAADTLFCNGFDAP